MDVIDAFFKGAPFLDPNFPFERNRAAAEAQLASRSCKVGEAMISFWFLSPAHQVVETLVINALFLPLVYFLARVGWRVGVPAAPAGARGDGGGLLALLDGALSATTLVCTCFTVWYKLQPDCAGRVRLAYILQPCHLSNLMLLTLSGALAAGWGARFAALFEVYQCTVFGALFALATPDYRGLYLPFETLHFHVQHWLLLALPCVWIARRRFPIFEDWRSWVCCWAGMTLVHWDVFQPACWLSGHNVNYMMVPPGVPLVEAAGKAYRPLMIAVCLVVSWIVKQGACGGPPPKKKTPPAPSSHTRALARTLATIRSLAQGFRWWPRCRGRGRRRGGRRARQRQTLALPRAARARCPRRRLRWRAFQGRGDTERRAARTTRQIYIIDWSLSLICQ
jgi:hypothetical protein